MYTVGLRLLCFHSRRTYGIRNRPADVRDSGSIKIVLGDQRVVSMTHGTTPLRHAVRTALEPFWVI